MQQVNTPGHKRRVGYIRVSTASGEQLSALENQRARVLATGVDEIIEDVQSGRESDRAGLVHLLDLISRRQLAEIVFTRIDRLGRDAADTDATIAFAAKHGVRLTALDGGSVESETPQGFVLSRIMTTMAEMESRMLSQRIKAGFAQRRKRREPYNGRAPWGYRCTACKTALEPDPAEWPRCQAFVALLEELGWRMNTALRAWKERHPEDPLPLNSCRAVKAWLKNPVLRGGIGYKQLANHEFEELVWDLHEPVLSAEQFTTLERLVGQNRRMWGSNTKLIPRLLTGLCVCGNCGRRMTYAGGRTIPSVICKTLDCPQLYKSTREAVICPAINEALASHAHHLAMQQRDEPEAVTELRKRIAKAEALNEPLLADGIEAMKQEIVRLLSRTHTPIERLRELQDPNTYAHCTYEELRLLYQQFVERVEVTRQAVTGVSCRF